MGRDLKPGNAWSSPEERCTCSEWDSRASFPTRIRAHRLQVQDGFTCCSVTCLLLRSKASSGDQTGRSTRKEGYFGNEIEVSELKWGSSKILLSHAVD